MNKKGYMENLWFVIMEGIILIMVTFSLFTYVNNVADSTFYWKNFYARDTALLIDTMHGAPGQVNFNYDFLNINRLLEIELKEDRVEVYEYEPGTDKSRLTPGSFPFAQDKKVDVELKSFYSIYFVLEKLNIDDPKFISRIIITQDDEPSPQDIVQSCPSVLTGKLKQEKLFFRVEDNNMRLGTLRDLLKASYFKNKVYGGDNDLYAENIADVDEDDADFIVVFEFSEQDELTVFYDDSSTESERMACILASNLGALDYFADKNKGIRTTDHLAPEEEELKTLLEENTAVLLRMGTESNDLLKSENKVAPTIFDSIKLHYGYEE